MTILLTIARGDIRGLATAIVDVENRSLATTSHEWAAQAADHHEEPRMKYVVLIYSNPTTWEALPKEEADRVISDHFVVIDELTKSGELLNQFGLADPSNTKTVRNHDGVPAVTDGPFGEAKEYLAGVFLVDCESIDRVTEFSVPLAQYSTVEVRPLMDEGSGEEM